MQHLKTANGILNQRTHIIWTEEERQSLVEAVAKLRIADVQASLSILLVRAQEQVLPSTRWRAPQASTMLEWLEMGVKKELASYAIPRVVEKEIVKEVIIEKPVQVEVIKTIIQPVDPQHVRDVAIDLLVKELIRYNSELIVERESNLTQSLNRLSQEVHTRVQQVEDMARRALGKPGDPVAQKVTQLRICVVGAKPEARTMLIHEFGDSCRLTVLSIDESCKRMYEKVPLNLDYLVLMFDNNDRGGFGPWEHWAQKNHPGHWFRHDSSSSIAERLRVLITSKK